MKIIVDVMSGDNAPLEIVKGAFECIGRPNIELLLVGDEEIIKEIAQDEKVDLEQSGIEIVNAPTTLSMEDHPLSVVRDKSDSSMAVALKLLSEGRGDALVSAGNTGALHAGSTLIVRRIKGIQRSAIATVLPFARPTLLIDSGANTEVTKEQYEQFAIMGSVYMKKIFDIREPEVGLLNIGTERTKGTKALAEAFEQLENSENINFVGNIESKQLPFGACDVLVTDGFTGNIILKFTEGMGKFFATRLKAIYYKNLITKLSAAVIKGDFSKFRDDFDASRYGGAPMLGISRPVIKAHGSSNATAIKNAIKQAGKFIETGVIYDIVRSSPRVPKIHKEEEKKAESDE